VSRFEYLSNAVLQARSASNSIGGLGVATEISDSGLLELLEGKLAVLRFQLRIRDDLEDMASKIDPLPEAAGAEDGFPRQGSLSEGLQIHILKDKAAELGNELKSITQLYNDYAVPFELWEVCLEILNFSNYSGDSENSVMRETWIRLLEQAIRLGGIGEACAVVKRVGPKFYPGVGGSLPLDSICAHLEKAAQV
jgi:nuclear pore complex protein Nup155